MSHLFHAFISFICAVAFLLSGCAHSPQNIDPLEGYNRTVFTFNEHIDKGLLKPVAKGYRFITPDILQTSVANFFSNLGDSTVFINDLLQLRIRHAATDIGRLIINSTIGLAGFIDVAQELELSKNQSDFGLTLARWGIKHSPYFVIPFLGPSTVRDAFGKPIDWLFLSPWQQIRPDLSRYSLFALNVVSDRADLLDKEKVLDTAALDRYLFIRDAYLQRRRYQIDGRVTPAAEKPNHNGTTNDDFLEDEPFLYDEF